MFLPKRQRHPPDYKAVVTKNTTVSISSLFASLSLMCDEYYHVDLPVRFGPFAAMTAIKRKHVSVV